MDTWEQKVQKWLKGCTEVPPPVMITLLKRMVTGELWWQKCYQWIYLAMHAIGQQRHICCLWI